MLHGAFSIAIELVPRGQRDGNHLFSKGPRAVGSRHLLQGFLRHEWNQSCFHLPWTHCCLSPNSNCIYLMLAVSSTKLGVPKALLSLVLCSTPRTSERTMTLAIPIFLPWRSKECFPMLKACLGQAPTAAGVWKKLRANTVTPKVCFTTYVLRLITSAPYGSVFSFVKWGL